MSPGKLWLSTTTTWHC